MVENQPQNKDSSCIFTVVVLDDKNHDTKIEKIARPITGAARVAMGESVFIV